MSGENEPIQIEKAHYYVIQRRWSTKGESGWTDSSSKYWGEDGLPAALTTEADMTKLHGLGNVKMIRRDTLTTEVEIATDVHTEHCCAVPVHGCKYGDDETCTVVTGLRPQSYLCEDCSYDLNEGGGLELAHLLNEMYDKGREKGGICGRCGSEVNGLCYDCH